MRLNPPSGWEESMCQYSDTWLGFLQLICHLCVLSFPVCLGCAHGSEWGGKISTRISYLVISEDNSSVTAAHIDESWCSQHFRPPPVSEKTNNGCQQQLHLLHQCWERRAETDSSLYRSVLQRSFKNIFELKSMEVTEERRDTAERIHNIWWFLMTVKVSSYQKV